MILRFYLDLLLITSRQRVIPPMMTSGSPAEAFVVGVMQTTPHPPVQPFSIAGQVNIPPGGQGGGVQTIAGVMQVIPHPPGQPLPDGGQLRVPHKGQGGGVHTTVSVVQTIPHPPGHPLPAGGQEYDPPVGQGGGVQTTETSGAVIKTTATADTGTPRAKRMARKRAEKNRLSLLSVVMAFIKKMAEEPEDNRAISNHPVS